MSIQHYANKELDLIAEWLVISSCNLVNNILVDPTAKCLCLQNYTCCEISSSSEVSFLYGDILLDDRIIRNFLISLTKLVDALLLVYVPYK